MMDNELIPALEQASDCLSQKGNPLGAAEANRIAGILRLELKEYQDAVDEVARCVERASGSSTTSEEGIALYFAEAVRQERWASVVATRARGTRVVKNRQR